MRSLFLAILMLIVAGPGLSGCGAVEQVEQPDQTSTPLSEYLHQGGLPLVEARVIPSPGGNHTLLLYGFVASESGTVDAESQALDFLDNPAVEVKNLIKVRPELQDLNSSSNGNLLVSSDAPTADQSATDESTAELGSPGAENDDADLPDAVSDREAKQPSDLFEDDE